MRPPSGFYEAIFYHIGSALHSDLECTAYILGAVAMFGSAVTHYRSRRQNWKRYALAGLCMGGVALLHSIPSRLLAGVVLVLAGALLAVSIAAYRSERRSRTVR